MTKTYRDSNPDGSNLGRTNTRNGDGLCQAFYGTEDATYELNKAAAGLAKQATKIGGGMNHRGKWCFLLLWNLGVRVGTTDMTDDHVFYLLYECVVIPSIILGHC